MGREEEVGREEGRESSSWRSWSGECRRSLLVARGGSGGDEKERIDSETSKVDLRDAFDFAQNGRLPQSTAREDCSARRVRYKEDGRREEISIVGRDRRNGE